MKGVAAVLFAAALSACAHGPGGRRATAVVTEGWAPLGAQGREHAHDRALADALRRAVETVTGVLVEGRSAVENAVTLTNAVNTRSRGSVASWKVLDERLDDGLLKLKVRAKVVEGPAPSGGSVALKVADARLAAGIARALTEKGMTVDRHAFTKVTGTASSRSLKVSVFPGTETFRANAELTVTGREGPARRIFEEASALGVEPETTIAKAVEAAGYKAGLALADALK